MGVNKERPHLVVIPEDEANLQLVNGFIGYFAVNSRQLGLESPAGGWMPALTLFRSDYITYLRKHRQGYVVILIDFDGQGDARRATCEEEVPDDLKGRVFVLGTRDEPEALRREIKQSLESIGESAARDCAQNHTHFWGHDHLTHNLTELARLLPIAHPILFPGA
jgi:hypothetical protein